MGPVVERLTSAAFITLIAYTHIRSIVDNLIEKRSNYVDETLDRKTMAVVVRFFIMGERLRVL